MSDVLHRPIEEWPLLLAGPMLRRVTEQSVAVFVAMTQRCDVQLRVYVSPGAEPMSTRVLHNRVVSLGLRLHVCVVEVAPPSDGRFEPGQVYWYDVRITDVTNLEFGLADLPAWHNASTILSGDIPLGYSNGALPTFAVPLDRDHLRIAHASCRKPHGSDLSSGKDPDALPLLDRLFSDHLLITNADERLRQRPDQVIMTGDQIYADDVAASLLAALTSIGRNLLAWGTPEKFPDRMNVAEFPDNHDYVKPGKRSIFLDEQNIKVRPSYAEDKNRTDEDVDDLKDMEEDDLPDGGNPDDYAANHLLFFSEWCAMYILNWSPTLWAPRDAAERNLYPNSPMYTLPRATDHWEHSMDTTSPALIFADGLPYVRRVLANVPTYMIFDDHDITDDWFLNRAVHDRMRQGEDNQPSAGGRRLMRNALAAYAIFQHWGNAPEQFADGKVGGALLDLFDLEKAGESSTPLIGQPGHENGADTLLDVGIEPIGVARRAERMAWHYTLQFPSHRLLVLDTRTWREFPGSLEQTGVTEVMDAMEERIEDLGEWGLSELRELTQLWMDTAQELIELGAGRLGQLINAGAELMDRVADVVAAIPTVTGPTEEMLIDTVDRMSNVLDSIGACSDIDSTPWASMALDKARVPLNGWAIDPESEAVQDAVNLALAMDKGIMAIRADVERRAATFAIATAVDAAQRASAAMFMLANWVDGVSAFIKGAAASQAEAARKAALMYPQWVQFCEEVAGVITNASATAVARIAQTIADSAPVQLAFEAAVNVHSSYLDPVWTLLLGKGADELNAGLISNEALDFQVREVLAGDGTQPPFTIVVSPAPLFGHWLVEVYQSATMSVGYSIGSNVRRLSESRAESNENEPWAGNLRAYYRALAALASLRSIVVLSGDVHYSFSCVNDYVGRNGRRARFIQLTSSSAKNSWLPSRALALADVADPRELLNPVRIGTEVWNALPTESVEGLATRENLQWIQDRVWQDAEQEYAELAENFQTPQWDLDWQWPNLSAVAAAKSRELGEAVERAKFRAVEYMRTPMEYDFLYNLPLMTQQTLLLLHQFGLDSAQFDQVETTVLQDRRLHSRALDSTELEARLLEREVERPFILQSERRTVGRANIGIVSFPNQAGGTAVVHELYSYPFDRPPWILGNVAPPPSPVFRGDWIIARHVAGLTLNLPADMGVHE